MGGSRKRVALEHRETAAAEVRRLLALPGPNGAARFWTQASLGNALGVSQETIRRAVHADGVTPAVVDGLNKLLLEKWSEGAKAPASASGKLSLRIAEIEIEGDSAAVTEGVVALFDALKSALSKGRR